MAGRHDPVFPAAPHPGGSGGCLLILPAVADMIDSLELPALRAARGDAMQRDRSWMNP
jgi:hypothetical protein